MQLLVAVPVTLALVYRAWSRKSLTPLGIVVAALTATAHAIHPWSIFFALLVVFFLGGTAVTKAGSLMKDYTWSDRPLTSSSFQVKHEAKARLTLSASGSSGGEGARTHVQVLANSIVASILILLHARHLHLRDIAGVDTSCWSRRGDLLVVGIIA